VQKLSILGKDCELRMKSDFGSHGDKVEIGLFQGESGARSSTTLIPDNCYVLSPRLEGTTLLDRSAEAQIPEGDLLARPTEWTIVVRPVHPGSPKSYVLTVSTNSPALPPKMVVRDVQNEVAVVPIGSKSGTYLRLSPTVKHKKPGLDWSIVQMGSHTVTQAFVSGPPLKLWFDSGDRNFIPNLSKKNAMVFDKTTDSYVNRPISLPGDYYVQVNWKEDDSAE